MDRKIKIYRDIFKKDISGYNLCKNSVIVQLLLTIWKRAAFGLKNYGIFKGSSTCCVCALCALGFKKDGKVRKLERYITQRSISVWVLTSRPTEYQYNVSVQAFWYISTGIAEIYSSSITESDIHHRILATITFLLKCCVMTQQEGIMQDVNTFAGTDQCQLPEYGPYSYMYMCKSIYLHTIIRAVLPSTCTVVRNAFGHLISVPHYFQTFGWIGFIYGLMIGMGPKTFSVPSPPPPMAWSSKSRTWKFIVVKISFPNESFSYFPQLSQTN